MKVHLFKAIQLVELIILIQMYFKPLDVILLDNANTVSTPISILLLKKFQGQISVITFADLNKCTLSIQRKTIVFVLSYPLSGSQRATEMPINSYNILKLRFPNNEIVLITSVYDVLVATEKMNEEISVYLDKAMHNRVKSFIDRVAIHPIKKYITYPIQKIIREFSVNKFVVIFFLAFVSVGLLVVLGTWAWDKYHSTTAL